MAGTPRRLVADRPDSWVGRINAVIDMWLGNARGWIRIWGDDGLRVNPVGGGAPSSGPASGNYALDIRPDSGLGIAVAKSGTANAAARTAANSVLLVGDSGVTLGTGIDFLVGGNLKWKSGTSFTMTLDHAATADRTVTVQDATQTLVGRDTTDTLTNKTLTNPTINAAALSGTVTGSPTFSGSPVFSTLINLTGGQITFPATQVSSADANTLDDYEEGSWTPSLGGTATYALQEGRYIKIGRSVAIWCTIAVTTIGTGSVNTISGLPYGADLNCVGHVSNWGSLAVAVTSLTLLIASGAATAQLQGATAAAVSSGIINGFQNGASVRWAAVYRTGN